jgi:hypothetical protein
MAAGILPRPGTRCGPCEDWCKHTDCEGIRNIANSVCGICKKMIAYGNRFYIDPKNEKAYVHAICLEDGV